MSSNVNKSFLYGSLGGFIIYVFSMISSELVYMNLSDVWDVLLFVLSVLLGCAVVVFIIVYKCQSFPQSIIRFFTLIFFCASYFAMGGYIGIVHLVHCFFGFVESSAKDNVSGMLLLSFYIVVFALSLVSLVLISVIRKHRARYHVLTKDK